MKRIIKLWILVVVVTFCLPVFAASHTTGELIPVNESATVDTDMFTYTDIAFVPKIEGKEYGKFTFKNVTNKTTNKVPISIDILLFDANRLNIGYVAYCTEEDISGDYAQKKLGAGASSPLSFNAGERYFIEEKGPQDVAYYAVLDDNPYCHVGGKDKYEGLTIEEILKGGITTKTEEDPSIEEISKLLEGGYIMVFLIMGVGVIVAFVIQGLILNALHKRMFASTTGLAYLPIGCNYVSCKLAFGEKIGKIYVIAYFVSFVGIIIKPLILVSYLLSFVSGIAFILVIVKLITKKYDLCYLEPFTNNENVAMEGNYTVVGDQKPEDNTITETHGDTVETPEETNNSFLNGSAGQEIVDLSYSSDNTSSNSFEDDTPNSFNYNVNDFVNFNDNTTEDSSNNEESQNTNNNNKEGESDLMDLFR